MSTTSQLTAFQRLHEQFERHGIEYWLFGGWAVDFHAGSVTRPHDDLDLALWLDDYPRVEQLLVDDGWSHMPEPGADGYTTFTLDDVQLEIAFLARDENDTVYTPLRQGRGTWPPDAFKGDRAVLRGVTARVIALPALMADKSEGHDDPTTTAKDSADLLTLAALTPPP